MFQRMWLGEEVVGDEWITVAAVHFRGPVYAAGPNPSEAINRLLAPDVYLQLLRRKPAEFGTFTFRGRQYLRFEYKNVPRPEQGSMGRILAFAGLSWFRCDAVAWVDSETSRLVKVVIALNTPSNPGTPDEEVGLYFYFDQPLSIVAPPFSLVRKM